jgi:hypothetical protein
MESKVISLSCTWAYGFLQAFNRSFSTTSMPMWSGDFERRM